MMQLDAAIARVVEVAAKQLDVPVGAETAFVADGLLDSLSLVNLIAALDQAFGVTTPNEELRAEHFETPATIAQLYVRQLEQR